MAVDILKEIAAVVTGADNGALATIVKTKGSTPRKAGAKMVVRPDGTAIGTICGGCVEAEVYAEALRVLETGRCKLMTFHLTADEADELGMKCGGSMDVFIEPLFGTGTQLPP